MAEGGLVSSSQTGGRDLNLGFYKHIKNRSCRLCSITVSLCSLRQGTRTQAALNPSNAGGKPPASPVMLLWPAPTRVPMLRPLPLAPRRKRRECCRWWQRHRLESRETPERSAWHWKLPSTLDRRSSRPCDATWGGVFLVRVNSCLSKGIPEVRATPFASNSDWL